MLAALVAVGASTVGGLAGAAPAAAPYAAISTTVTSFDGTPIAVNFYPANGLTLGQQAPTVLDGSGWGLPAYPSWLGTVGALGTDTLSFDLALLGPATLTADGFNVVTWNPRGMLASGGQVSVDQPDIDGRDVSAIIDWVATLPAAELKGPDDPVVGMTGASYGGGIQISAAIDDHRLDAIEPNLAWDSLIDSLYPNQVIKAGWGNLLCLIGDVEGYTYEPELTKICASAQSGQVTPDEVTAGQEASPGTAVGQITTPTLLIGGTVDTLFPVAGDVAIYDLLKAAGTPVQMLWYCGGHGLCNLDDGDASYVTTVELQFLDKYLKHEPEPVRPDFVYQDQTGAYRAAPSYPLPTTGQLSAAGGGLLGISPFDSSGTLGIAGTPASNAVNIPVPAPSHTVEVTSAPTLTLTYAGLASQSTTPIFAQLVDTSSDQVLDNQVTPVLLTLDGATHTVTVPLNLVTWQLDRSSQIELQLTDASDLYFAQQALGAVAIQQAQLTVPYSSAP